MSRNQLIQFLIVDALEHGDDQNRYHWLEQVLENGFCGFASMSDAALLQEARRRGIPKISKSSAVRSAAHDIANDPDEYDPELSQLIAHYSPSDGHIDFT